MNGISSIEPGRQHDLSAPEVGGPVGAGLVGAETGPEVMPLAEQVFTRAAGAPLVPGNAVRLLRDATENYPAWLAAIQAAERWIHFESYIFTDDATGREFVEALAAKARSGVRVRLLFDWLGTRKSVGSRFWRPLLQAGGVVRCFNPPRLDSPFGWLRRDHRKMIAIDGRIGFVSGLCVSAKWQGDPQKRLEPWRDTGVEVRGPAVAGIEQAFAQVWTATGGHVPAQELPVAGAVDPAGDTSLRVIGSAPNTAGLFRLDQVVAAVARRTLWLTDAYFVGMAPYVQALGAAAADGVDVRLLVPGASDLPVLQPFTRAGYRPLLGAGVRVFEWNGPMLHAKSAVSDGRWSRVGSTNLNLASWIGNYELDVFVEDARFAAAMEQMYLDDLSHATEIVLGPRRRVRPVARPSVLEPRVKDRRGIPVRAAASALRLANTVGAAVGNRRLLGPAEARITAWAGVLLLALTLVCALWPLAVTVPLAVAGAWLATALLVKAWRLYRQGRAAHRLRPASATRAAEPRPSP